MQKIVYLICLFLSVIYTRSEAQIFQYIGTADGLSSRRVLSIQQGEHDYIWILTHKGVDRYNGKQFTHYPLIKNGAVVNCFPNLNILKTDREKKLWEIGKDGLVFNLNEARDSFQLVFDLHEQYPETQKCPITCIYLDEEKNIWFCTEGYQYIYNGDTQKTRKISHKIPGKVTCITQAKGNNYFISTEQTLYSATLNKGELTNVRKIDISNINIIDYIYYHKPTNKLIINALLDKLFIYLRTKFGSFGIKKNDTLRDIIALKREGIRSLVIFLADQTPSPSNLHYWTTWLNQDTPMLTGPERIARKLNIPVIYLDVRQLRRGYYDATLHIISENPKDTPEFWITEKYARMMERSILRDPAYYLWTHKRWKHKKRHICS